MSSPPNDEPTDLDWVKLRSELSSQHQHAETAMEKFDRKFKANPFVPIGVCVTAAALGYGLWCFRTGKSRRSQHMMRLRIAAQGFTIAALVFGVMSAGKNLK